MNYSEKNNPIHRAYARPSLQVPVPFKITYYIVIKRQKAPFRRKPSNIACGKGATVCCSRRWFIQLITLP
ncbi:hypothetical protein ABID47_002773 [Paenibacillus favisporus]|uniref:Uncharacterized protein n=1 Tax=Paenibacillus favisporus TaxID=221028 RepID=A0ABV2F340_9BACL